MIRLAISDNRSTVVVTAVSQLAKILIVSNLIHYNDEMLFVRFAQNEVPVLGEHGVF